MATKATKATNHGIKCYLNPGDLKESINRFSPTVTFSKDPHGNAIHINAVEIANRITTMDIHTTPEYFTTLLNTTLQEFTGTIKIYGEIVSILVANDHPDLAIHLEGIWNDYLKDKPHIHLLCGYNMNHFKNPIDAQNLRTICDCHHDVIPAREESPTDIIIRQQQAMVIKTLRNEISNNSVNILEGVNLGIHISNELGNHSNMAFKTKTENRTIDELLKYPLDPKYNNTDNKKIIIFKSANGSKKYLLMSINTINNLTIHTVQDITALRELTDQHEENISNTNSFVDILCHELRGTLFAILGSLEVLVNNINSGSHTKHKLLQDLEPIITSAKFQRQLLNDVLDLSRLKYGTSFEAKNTDPSTILNKGYHILKSRAKEKGITVTVNSPTTTIKTDPKRFTQIVVNLLTNAIKYTDNGGLVELSGSIHGATFRFQIKDNGRGMTQEQKEGLFEKFMKVGEGWENESSGLGLHIVKIIIDKMDGIVDINTAVGKGTTITIDIPNVVTDEFPVVSSDEQLSDEEPNIESHIAIVEDNSINSRVLAKLCDGIGVTYELFTNGGEIVESIKKGKKYGLILMDMEMPVMNGLEATQAIRDMKNDTPIVFLSGNARETYKESTINIANGYLNKPISKNGLQKAIQQYTKKS